MAETKEAQPNYVEMTHACNACDEDCEIACKNGTCRIIPKEQSL